MPKLKDLPDHEILVATDDPNTLRAVGEVKAGIKDGNPHYAQRTWYTTDKDFEPCELVEIREEE